MGNFGDNLDAAFGALLKPDQSARDKAQTALKLSAELSGIPGAGIAVKGLVLGQAWFFDGKKPDRIFPVLLGLKERIEKLEVSQRDYLRTEQAQAAVEEAFGRIAAQPDEQRRREMQLILYNILEKPRDPAENKLFLRLADELPAQAMKLLSATGAQLAPGERMSTKDGLMRHAGLTSEEGMPWLKYLINQGLFDEDQLGHVQRGNYRRVLTPVGLAFEEYRRG